MQKQMCNTRRGLGFAMSPLYWEVISLTLTLADIGPLWCPTSPHFASLPDSHFSQIFCIIYLAGLIMVVFGSIPGHVDAALFFPAIYIIAIGMVLHCVFALFATSQLKSVNEVYKL